MSTALLATLKAVFKDGSTPIRSRPAIQPIALAQYTAGHILIECVNSDGSPHSLAYDTLLLGVRLHPTDATSAILVQASNLDTDPDGEPADNWARCDLVPGHWIEVPPRLYGCEVVALIGGDPDDRLSVVPHSQWKVTPADVHPGDDISVPDSQQPLAQGPAGAQGPQGPQGPKGETFPDDTPTNGTFELVLFNGEFRTRQHERVVATFNGLSAQATANWPTFDGRPFRAVVSCAKTDDVEALNPQLVDASLNDFSCVIQIADSEAECEVVIDLLEVLS